MLIIGEDQMEAMCDHALERFRERNAARLRATHPAKTADLSDAELRERIDEATSRARTYAVVDEDDVERYLDCVMVYGMDFDTDPQTGWAGTILGNRLLIGSQKMDQICDYIAFAPEAQS